MNIYNLEQIKQRIDINHIIKEQKKAFVNYTRGLADIPMPGYLEYSEPDSSYHLKYGYQTRDDHWVLKVAGGPHHLPINGFMIAINTQSGRAEYMLDDQGYLTALRTAIAGLISTQYLANQEIKGIGVIGTGLQARLQVELLQHITDCKTCYVWGRSQNKCHLYQKEMTQKGFQVIICDEVSTLASQSNVIITATASKSPILKMSHIKPGTHITAVGADSPGKIELDPLIVSTSDLVVVDSKHQCADHGEISHALNQNSIGIGKLIELGEIIQNPALGRTDPNQISMVDLTGLAIQDIAIAKAVIQFRDTQVV